MRVSSIALIGFRATGKSTLGGLLAERLHWKFLDMDRELVRRFGVEIQEWVQRHGWPSFRREESRVLEELCDQENLVLATGGGVIESPENRELLKKNFWVIWLQAGPSTVLERLKTDPRTSSNRPPLTQLSWTQEVRVLIERRTPLYAECAHLALDTECRPQSELLQGILTAMGHV